MSNTFTTPQLEVTFQLVKNNTERLEEHVSFEQKLAMLLHDATFKGLDAQKKLASVDLLLKEHQAALAPLERVGSALTDLALKIR